MKFIKEHNLKKGDLVMITFDEFLKIVPVKKEELKEKHYEEGMSTNAFVESRTHSQTAEAGVEIGPRKEVEKGKKEELK